MIATVILMVMPAAIVFIGLILGAIYIWNRER